MASPFISIIEQHAEEAAFLWLLYSQELEAPNPNPDELAKLKKRINAHVKGLIVAREDGWNCCMKALETQREAGEVFAASILALQSAKKSRFEAVLHLIEATPATDKAMASALDWLPSKPALA